MAQILAAGCIDPRFQVFYDRWLRDKFGVGGFYSVRIAGVCFDRWTVVEQIDRVQKLTDLTQVILLPHEECRMYDEKWQQLEDLIRVHTDIHALWPHLGITVCMVHLDGTFEHIVIPS